MKFGSVAFFKRLIVITFIIILLLPIVLAIVFGVRFAQEKKRADWLEQVNWALLNTEELPEELKNAEDISKYMQNLPQNVAVGPSFEYQKAYPELYALRPETVPDEGKVCYLTFDDGPSPVTLQVLNILSEYDIKATFFVTGANSEDNPDILKAVADAGHTVGVHTYSHNYREVYASVDAFLADFEKMHRLVTEVTGTPPSIFRFPGGSINAYSQGLYQPLIAEMTRRGFVYYDWNAAGNDAVSGGAKRADIVKDAVATALEYDKVILLLHDRQDTTTTAAALPDIIEDLLDAGYTFAPLSAEVEPVFFPYQS